MTVVTTQRLVLREFREEDRPSVHAYSSDPEVVKHLLWGPNTEEETQGFIAGAMKARDETPRRRYDFAVTLKETGELVGGARLVIASAENREAWIGYCFHPGAWGKGFATEVSQALLALGFDRLDLHRIVGTCDPRNLGSARVLEKIGMTREGCLRQHKRARGRWRDSLVCAILDHEWQTRFADAPPVRIED